jgi:uncharacterized protein
MVDQEYNSFGPWIYEVNDNYPMPPLFVPYYKVDKNYLMLVKIPRNIERRDAKPGMDLYDYVIGLYGDYIYILKRAEKLVKEFKVFYKEVECINNFIDLLFGCLTIKLRDNEIIIPYNAVSEDVIMRLIKTIRDRYTKMEYNLAVNSFIEEDIKVDDLYVNLLNRITNTEQRVKIGAVQSSVLVTPSRHASLWQRVRGSLVGEKLLNTLHLLNDKELIVISRGKHFKKFYESVYSCTFLYIPIEKLNSIKFENYERYNNLQKLKLELTNNSFEFYYEESNKEFIDFYNNIKDRIR